MGNRSAKFISALFASVIAGVPLSAVSQNAPTAPATAAADDCLASPKKTAPQGQHWYYRLERGTKRQCWYLREEGAKAAQGTTTAPAPDSAASRSVQDARAELTAAQTAPVQRAPVQPTPAQDTTASTPTQATTVATPAATQRPNEAATGAQQPALDARWPDSSGAAPAPDPQAALAAKIADARPAAKPAASLAPAPVPLAAAEAPVAKPTGSLQTLLLVIGAALALAGITGSIIYRFGGARVPIRGSEGARRRVNWEPPADNGRAPWADAVGLTPLAQRPQPIDYGFALATTDKPAAKTRGAIETFADDLREVEATTMQHHEAGKALESTLDDGSVETHVAVADAGVEPADDDADAIDIDALTRILERLAQEGPKLSPSQPIAEAGPADFAQSPRARSGVRA